MTDKDSFRNIIGHARAVRRLRTMLANGTFPHAVLITGPRRVGKIALAFAAASALLSFDDPERHPDFRLIERPRDEKTDKLKKRISVEAVRDAQAHLRMRSFLGGAKVVVVDGADMLSDEAANAFLKTLEEPSSGSYVFLCAENAERLPNTIVSRSAVIGLRRVPISEIDAALQARGLSVKDAARAAALSDGRPGDALGFLGGTDMIDWYETEARRWTALRGAPIHQRFSLLADLAPPRADREETILRLRAALDTWQSLLRRELHEGVPSAASNLRRLFALEAALDVNVQPRLLLERFALTLDR